MIWTFDFWFTRPNPWEFWNVGLRRMIFDSWNYNFGHDFLDLNFCCYLSYMTHEFLQTQSLTGSQQFCQSNFILLNQWGGFQALSNSATCWNHLRLISSKSQILKKSAIWTGVSWLECQHSNHLLMHPLFRKLTCIINVCIVHRGTEISQPNLLPKIAIEIILTPLLVRLRTF